MIQPSLMDSASNWLAKPPVNSLLLSSIDRLLVSSVSQGCLSCPSLSPCVDPSEDGDDAEEEDEAFVLRLPRISSTFHAILSAPCLAPAKFAAPGPSRNPASPPVTNRGTWSFHVKSSVILGKPLIDSTGYLSLIRRIQPSLPMSGGAPVAKMMWWIWAGRDGEDVSSRVHECVEAFQVPLLMRVWVRISRRLDEMCCFNILS